jgi:hypothetical protein
MAKATRVHSTPPTNTSAIPITPNKSEKAGDYHAIVAQLNDRWRVIACLAGIQWILQVRSSSETYPTSYWKGRSLCPVPGKR